jgi:molybdopterin/thiamine biosynthesis adenylyltransferase
MELIPPGTEDKITCTIIGAGASGSSTALVLAQMGVKTIDVWDYDTVESHNLPNQAYDLEHIDMPKVEALAHVIRRKCGTEITVHNERVESQNISPKRYVFLMVDTMKSRKEIFENCIYRKCFGTDLVIETRMGPDGGRCYAFNPNNPLEVETWRKTLYTDEQSSVSACGATLSLAPTVWFLASLGVWSMVHHFDVNYGANFTKAKGKEMYGWFESVFQLGPVDFYNSRSK